MEMDKIVHENKNSLLKECKQIQDMQIIHYGLVFFWKYLTLIIKSNGSSKMAPFWHQNL
jgi:hypothetical protein